MTTYSAKTPAGKAISARNATTHGLFCRQTVLPHLGEDPAGYQKILDTLSEQLRPRNLMERQYIELWAEASWKLRRLSRFEAQVWEDDRLEEDLRLVKLERLSRLQTTLRRQLDKSVQMLSQTVPQLFAHRTREDVMQKMKVTESVCQDSNFREQEVQLSVQANLHWPAPPEDIVQTLDNVDAPPPVVLPPADRVPAADPQCAEVSAADDPKNCQNELAPAEAEDEAEEEYEEEGETEEEGEEEANGEIVFCQNELPPEPQTPAERRAQKKKRLKELEDLINSGTLSPEERFSILTGPEVNHWGTGGGRYTIHS